MPRLKGLELQARYRLFTEAPRTGGDRYGLIHLPESVALPEARRRHGTRHRGGLLPTTAP
jgi:hypothetical protein